MVSRLIIAGFSWVHKILNKPFKVFLICLGVAFVSLVLEGSLFQLWSLHRNSQDLDQKIVNLQAKNYQLDMKIEKVSDPNFLELEVRNQFDYVKEGDLVFIFTAH